MECEKPNPSLQLPQDLVGPIAAAIDTCCASVSERTAALRSCMLVCHSFATEFRPYLYRDFHITGASPARSVLSEWLHSRTLAQHPGYQRFIKNVVIAPITWKEAPWSILSSPDFPSLIDHLPEVVSFTLKCPSATRVVSYRYVNERSRNSIARLCSLTSIRHLWFENVVVLPPGLLYRTPNLQVLNIHSVDFIPGGMNESVISHPIHLNMSGSAYTVLSASELATSVPALAVFLKRVSKLSGSHRSDEKCREAHPLAQLLGLGIQTLQKVNFKVYVNRNLSKNKLFNSQVVDFSRAEKLECLSLAFDLSDIRPGRDRSSFSFSDILETLTQAVFTPNGNGRMESLIEVKLTIPIPNANLTKAAIEQERGWRDLDLALANRDHLPKLRMVELRLLVQKDLACLEQENISDLFLCSLPREARKVMVAVDSSSF